jgi:hypothetical protein
MRKTSFAVAVALIGSALFGGAAMASERGELRGKREEKVEKVVHVPSRVVEQEAPRFAPPALPVIHARKLRGYVFIPGEYEFKGGRFVFIPGHYEREQPGMYYKSSVWVQRDGRFVKVPGFWSRA